VDANKLERALDAVDRLHLEMSYDLAIQIAGRHDKLADLIEGAKDRKFPSEQLLDGSAEDSEILYDEEEESHRSPETTKFLDRLAPQISPEADPDVKRNNRSGGDAFQQIMRKKQRVG